MSAATTVVVNVYVGFGPEDDRTPEERGREIATMARRALGDAPTFKTSAPSERSNKDETE